MSSLQYSKAARNQRQNPSQDLSSIPCYDYILYKTNPNPKIATELNIVNAKRFIDKIDKNQYSYYNNGLLNLSEKNTNEGVSKMIFYFKDSGLVLSYCSDYFNLTIISPNSQIARQRKSELIKIIEGEDGTSTRN